MDEVRWSNLIPATIRCGLLLHTTCSISAATLPPRSTSVGGWRFENDSTADVASPLRRTDCVSDHGGSMHMASFSDMAGRGQPGPVGP